MVAAIYNKVIDERPTLEAWLGEYIAIEQEYLDGLMSRGIDLAPP